MIFILCNAQSELFSMEFSVDPQMMSHTVAAFQVGSDSASGILNYLCNIMKFTSLSPSRARVSGKRVFTICNFPYK